jgi:hypothetical protein
MPESKEPNIASKISSFFKELFKRRDPFKLVSINTDFSVETLIHEQAQFYKDNAENILNELNNHLAKFDKTLVLTNEHFNEALKYPVTELKPGDSVKVKDGKVTYEELQEVVRNVENVTLVGQPTDVKVPKIFVTPDLSSVNLNIQYIANSFLSDFQREVQSNGYLNMRNINGDIILSSDFISKITAEELKGGVAHESGHSADFKERNFIEVKANINGSQAERDKIDSCLSHDREKRADERATLAGYGNNLIKLFLHPSLREEADGGHTHPSHEERIKRIIKIKSEPDLYKTALENDLAEFRKHVSEPTNANQDHPIPPTAQVVEHCTNRIVREH